MPNPAYPEPRVTEAVIAGEPAPPAAYAALCPTCPYEGPVRVSNLTALRDYDRHVATLGHQLAAIRQEVRDDDDDE